jgi:hypothetical protein
VDTTSSLPRLAANIVHSARANTPEKPEKIVLISFKAYYLILFRHLIINGKKESIRKISS